MNVKVIEWLETIKRKKEAYAAALRCYTSIFIGDNLLDHI